MRPRFPALCSVLRCCGGVFTRASICPFSVLKRPALCELLPGRIEGNTHAMGSPKARQSPASGSCPKERCSLPGVSSPPPRPPRSQAAAGSLSPAVVTGTDAEIGAATRDLAAAERAEGDIAEQNRQITEAVDCERLPKSTGWHAIIQAGEAMIREANTITGAAGRSIKKSLGRAPSCCNSPAPPIRSFQILSNGGSPATGRARPSAAGTVPPTSPAVRPAIQPRPNAGQPELQFHRPRQELAWLHFGWRRTFRLVSCRDASMARVAAA